MNRLAGLLLVIVSYATAQTPSAGAAGSLWEHLQAVPWDATYADWQRAHLQLACRQSPEGEHPTLPDELWSYRCAQAAQPVTSEWLFYALSLDQPLAARLEQFHASINGLALAELEETHREISLRLTARYGAGVDPGKVSEPGSAFFRNIRRWQSGDLQLSVYLFARGTEPPRLELQARRRVLLDALATEQRLRDWQMDQLAEAGSPLDNRLAHDLGAEFPRLPALLQRSQPEQDQAAIQPLLLDLLQAARVSLPERRAMLMMAADRLAARLLAGERESPQWEQQRNQLARFGLNFEWDELGAAWQYTHDLLWRIWEEYAGMPWGEQAFVLLESHGWETHVGCQSGSDQFGIVIQTTERFLREHTQSPHRAEVQFLLAQAYETWWSLSHAPEQDDYVDRTKYVQGSDVARQRAVAHYEELLQMPDAGDYAAYARLVLPRLKLALDTGQRRFFCVYD